MKPRLGTRTSAFALLDTRAGAATAKCKSHLGNECKRESKRTKQVKTNGEMIRAESGLAVYRQGNPSFGQDSFCISSNN
jgi:hypothetical protein